ncbi:MAG: hypothetical protein LC721_03495 [Actinobacteria bacterium]|nr:hypothetical protein [Actinomycetota bacterium]
MVDLVALFDVYACEACRTRTLVVGWPSPCVACGAERERLGIGGACPHYDQPVAVVELVVVSSAQGPHLQHAGRANDRG